MPILGRDELKSFFRTESEPDQSEFWAWLDSFFHKNDMIPIARIQGLSALLNTLPKAMQPATLNADGPVTVANKCRIHVIVLESEIVQTISIGRAAGASDIAELVEVLPGEASCITTIVSLPANGSLYFSNITSTLNIEFHKL